MGVVRRPHDQKFRNDIRLLSIEMDQSIHVLHRLRDAAIGMQEAFIFMLSYRQHNQQVNDVYLSKLAEYSARYAESRGLAFSVGDKELLSLINHELHITRIGDQTNLQRDETELRGTFQKIYTRLAQLLIETTERRRRRRK